METFWLLVGVIYFVLACFYFYLAYKSLRKVTLKNLQIDKLNAEPFMPKRNAGFEVIRTLGSNGEKTEVRSPVFVEMIKNSNYIIEKVQQHFNQSIFPSIKDYLDETSKINTRGFIIAGIISLIATSLAFCSAFKLL